MMNFLLFFISQFSNAVTKNTQGVTALQLSLCALVPSLFVFPGERGQSTSRLPTNLASHYQRSRCCDLSCKRSPSKSGRQGKGGRGGIRGVMRGGKLVTEQVVEVAEHHTGNKCSLRRHSCPKIIPNSLPAEFSHDAFFFFLLQFFGVIGAGSEELPTDGAALGSQRGSLGGTCCCTQSNHSKDMIRGNSKGAGCGRGAMQQICFLKWDIVWKTAWCFFFFFLSLQEKTRVRNQPLWVTDLPWVE